MNKPLVSIITPTYNRSYILGTAIEGVIAQTYTTWELVIIDDGSTDTTRELIRDFGDSRNGFAKAKRTRELYENGVMTQYVDDTARNYPDNLTLQDIFHREVKFDLNGFIHHRSITDTDIRFDPAFYKCEDWDYFFAIGDRYPHAFLFVPKTLYNYHQRFGGDGLVSNSTYRDWAIVHEMLYQKYQHSDLLVGQTWYPGRVDHWNKLADDFEKGLIPPYQLYYFQSTSHVSHDRGKSEKF